MGEKKKNSERSPDSLFDSLLGASVAASHTLHFHIERGALFARGTQVGGAWVNH